MRSHVHERKEDSGQYRKARRDFRPREWFSMIRVPRRLLLHQASPVCIISRLLSRCSLMNFALIPKELQPIAEKIKASKRIDEREALELYSSNDLNSPQHTVSL